MTDIHSCSYYCDRPDCIKAQRDELRDRLAQPEQKPVAVWELQEDGWETICDGDWLQTLPVGTKLYTTPPQRTWVDLTPKEIEACRQKGYAHGGLDAPFDFDKAAGALLALSKEKNT